MVRLWLPASVEILGIRASSILKLLKVLKQYGTLG